MLKIVNRILNWTANTLARFVSAFLISWAIAWWFELDKVPLWAFMTIWAVDAMADKLTDVAEALENR